MGECEWEMIRILTPTHLEYYVAIITIWGIDWQKKSELIFYWPQKMGVLKRYCFRLISWFSNRVLSFFRRTSRATIALVFFFWSVLLNFNTSCRETTSSFLRLSWEGFFTLSSSWHDRWNLECIKNQNQIHIERWWTRNDVVSQLNRQNDISKTMISVPNSMDFQQKPAGKLQKMEAGIRWSYPVVVFLRLWSVLAGTTRITPPVRTFSSG